jgi:large subunit ribosomal protein L24
MAKIKRNDQVIVLAGKDKGKKGRVLRVINSAGGILEQEAAIHISNVALLDSDGKATRAGFRFDGDKKVRIARSNGGTLAEKKK